MTNYELILKTKKHLLTIFVYKILFRFTVSGYTVLFDKWNFVCGPISSQIAKLNSIIKYI